MAAIAGMRGTGDWGTDERPTNFRETILFRQPNGQAPLTALMSRMASEGVDDPQFQWFEEELQTLIVTETTGLASVSGSTALTASGGGLNNLVAGDLLLVDGTESTSYANEILEVASVTSDTAAVVVRGASSTVIAAIGAGAKLTKIGSAFSEGSDAPTSSSRNPTELVNKCQIFKTTYDLTETVIATRARTGPALKNDKKRRMFDHSVSLEWAWFFGQLSQVNGSNGKPKRTTQGLRKFITTNVTIFSTTPTTTTFLDAVTPVFNWNTGAGDERLVICGNGALNALNLAVLNHANSRINFDGVIKYYGMNLQRWTLPQGVLYFKTHPLFNLHPRYNYSMFVLDPTGIIYRPLRDTFFKDNVQGNGVDGKRGQWLTEAGIEVHHEKAMAYLGHVTYP